ncbi:MAG: uncharacterized protein KVP18_001053 [Porospora cf. gigantea A]|uniref:uncharacterized protein n=1 Tax=Porospora cf. gigantea A TaxID=2853593 RepID=UPI0035597255|nr:MAG: hypothetical protein KVP18_001053 [Porospora cf. gigantea A]
MFDIYSQVFNRQERLMHEQKTVRDPDVYDPVREEQHWFPASVEHHLRTGSEVRSRLLQDPSRAPVDVE